jgi:hypothetical protein
MCWEERLSVQFAAQVQISSVAGRASANVISRWLSSHDVMMWGKPLLADTIPAATINALKSRGNYSRVSDPDRII